MSVRRPAVAGTFYPARADELRARLDAHAGSRAAVVRAVGVIAPHAGYAYCGSVAAAVFGAVVLPARVLILGFKHRAPRQGAFLWSGEAWRTPLGDVPQDDELRQALLSRAGPRLLESEEQFAEEWSIETQLPWMQHLRALQHATGRGSPPPMCMVAVAVNGVTPDAAEELGDAAAQAIIDQEPAGAILMVASSDIAHEHDERLARRHLDEFLQVMERPDARRLYNAITRGGIGMCGLLPAMVMLRAAEKLGATRAEVVAHSTSADVRRSPDGYTVAYAGARVY